MAEPIDYAVPPPTFGPDAHQELDRLLQGLHEHGFLRLANDLVRANSQIAQVLVDGLNQEGPLNVVQNVSILAMALSRIPPAQFYKVVFAVKDGFDQVSGYQADSDSKEAPGVSGAYRMLHDESLWRAILPLIEGLKAFATRLDQPLDKPISAFSGKPSEA